MILLYLVLFILGASIGSFFNVLIDRLVREEDIIFKPSHCEKCKHKLEILDLIPIISYLFLRGRCRYCKAKIPTSLPLIEIFSGIGLVVLYHLLLQFYIFNILDVPYIIFYFVLFSCCFLVFFTDVKYQLIPSVYIYVLVANLVIFYVYTLFISHSKPGIDEVVFGSLLEKLLAVVFIIVIFGLIYLFFRKNSIGEGDIYLFLSLSLYLGLNMTLVMWFISFLTGGLIGAILILIDAKKMQSKIAFGPFIIIGFIASLSIGRNIIDWYISLI